MYLSTWFIEAIYESVGCLLLHKCLSVISFYQSKSYQLFDTKSFTSESLTFSLCNAKLKAQLFAYFCCICQQTDDRTYLVVSERLLNL